MVRVLVIASMCLSFAACGKKSDAPPKAEPATKPAEPAAPAPSAASELAMPASGIAECDAVPAEYKKFQACAKISDDDRAVQQVNMQSLKDIPAAYTAEKDADKKAMLQKASATQCKDATAKLHELMAKAGC
jgi:hypothetical protein